MQSKLQIAFTSPATYSLLALFLFNGLQAIAPMLSGMVAIVVSVILGALTLYLHPSQVQKASAAAARPL